MQGFKAGQAVKIPCTAGQGAFPGERLVIIKSEGETISGFVRQEFVREGYVLGTVVAVETDRIVVKIPGSFFTLAAGTTSVSATWASSHLQPALA